MGRGYQWAEYHGFGIDFDDGTPRFEEALDLLLRSWTAQEPFSFEGAFHRYHAAFPQPRPAQQPHPPLWHATTSRHGLRRCAANEWGVMLAQATPTASVEAILADYRQELESAAKPFEADRVVLARGMHCAARHEWAKERFVNAYAAMFDLAAKVSAPPAAESSGAPHNPFAVTGPDELEAAAIVGDPDRCAAAVAALAATGVRYLILFVNPGGVHHDDVCRSLRLFAHEVAPRFAA